MAIIPTVTFDKKKVKEIIGKIEGKEITDDFLADRISMIGTDLEEVNEKEIIVEIFPNRMDMLSLEGFSFAIKNFIGQGKGYEDIKVEEENEEYKIIVEEGMKKTRPYTVAAIVKNLKLDEEKLKSLIQLQEKLDLAYNRKRKKAAIGIYPNKNIIWPISFKAKKPEEIKFQPLESDRIMTAKEILEEHNAGKKYSHLLLGKEKYAVFEDSEGNILSMPPIINSEKTGRVTVNDTELFIEVSGIHLPSLKKVLNIILFTLQLQGGKIINVKVEYPKEYFEEGIKTVETKPIIETIKVKKSYIEKILGIKINNYEEYEEYLKRMGLKLIKGESEDKIIIPSYRIDLLHPIDIAEEVAISYGYENFKSEMPKIATVGEEDEIELFKKKLAYTLVGFKLQEVQTYHIQKEELQKMLGEKPIMLENPMNKEYNSLRKNILSGLLEVIKNNKQAELPRGIFELGKTFHYDKTKKDVIEKEELGIIIEDTNITFTKIKQIIESILKKYYGRKVEYEEYEKEYYLKGRSAKIIIEGKSIIELGETNPKILSLLEIENPTVMLRIKDIELFYKTIKEKV